MKWSSEEIKREFIKRESAIDIESAEACIISARVAFADNKLDDAMYWLRLADVYCKLVVARGINDN